MIRRFTLLGCLLLSCANAFADPVDDWVHGEMSRRHIPGMVVGVYQDGEPVKVQAYGTADIENQIPMSCDSVLEIGSITKQFTAAAILMLREEGKLGLDDPIGKYLTGAPASWSGITVRHLLTHTSGLPDPGEYGAESSDSQETIRSLAALPISSPPGECWSYCNAGYQLLGHIIEKVSGETYHAFLRKRIFQPLGMTSTRCANSTALIPHRARGYSWDGQGWLNSDSISPSKGFAAASLLSTVADLEKWNRSLEQKTLLNSESVCLMEKCQRLTSGQEAWTECSASYGLGVFVRSCSGKLAVMHSGGTDSFSSQNTWFPSDRLSVIVLANVGDWSFRPFAGLKIASFYLAGVHSPFDEKASPESGVTEMLREDLKQWSMGHIDDSRFTPEYRRAGLELGPNLIRFAKLATGKAELKCVECVRQGLRTDYRFNVWGPSGEFELYFVLNARKFERLTCFDY